MKSPLLNRAMTLQDLQRSPDGSGGYAETWADLGTLWADVRATGGREGESDHAKLSAVKYLITVRAAPHGAPSRPKPDQRLVEGTRVYRIQAVAESDPKARFLRLHVVEEVAA